MSEQRCQDCSGALVRVGRLRLCRDCARWCRAIGGVDTLSAATRHDVAREVIEVTERADAALAAERAAQMVVCGGADLSATESWARANDGCGRRVGLRSAFRCVDCTCWYHRACAARHFGQRAFTDRSQPTAAERTARERAETALRSLKELIEWSDSPEAHREGRMFTMYRRPATLAEVYAGICQALAAGGEGEADGRPDA